MSVSSFPRCLTLSLGTEGGWAKGFQEIGAMVYFHAALWIETAAFSSHWEYFLHLICSQQVCWRFSPWLSLAPLCPNPEATVWECAASGEMMPKMQLWFPVITLSNVCPFLLITRAVWLEGSMTVLEECRNMTRIASVLGIFSLEPLSSSSMKKNLLFLPLW